MRSNPGSTMGTIENKPKEEYTETHINQTNQNKRQRENIENSKGKETTCKGTMIRLSTSCKGTMIRLSADFSAETLQARREWHDILNAIKGKTLQPRLLYPARLSFRFEGDIKTFTDKQKLREFSNTKAALQQILKELL